MKIIKKNPRKHPDKNDYSFIDAAVEKLYPLDGGLCSGRYKADMVAKLDGASPVAGDILDFGEDGKFRVTGTKDCFDDKCVLRLGDQYCSLHGHAFFAEKID